MNNSNINIADYNGLKIDNWILMKLWITDENCHKTLGEMLPIYIKYIKEKTNE